MRKTMTNIEKREKWNEYQKNYKIKNREKFNNLRLKYYYFGVEARRLMNILLD
jgi:hypothetical protein